MAKKPEYEESDEIKNCRARFNAILECFCDAYDRMAGRGLEKAMSVNISMELTGAAFYEAFKSLRDIREENLTTEVAEDEGEAPEEGNET